MHLVAKSEPLLGEKGLSALLADLKSLEWVMWVISQNREDIEVFQKRWLSGSAIF